MRTQTAIEWNRRIERASQLTGSSHTANQVLEFYSRVLEVQAAISQDLLTKGDVIQPDKTLREQIDFDSALAHLPTLVEVSRKYGTAILSDVAEQVSAEGSGTVRQAITDELRGVSSTPTGNAICFFARALLQPAAEYLAQQLPSVPHSGGRCPNCESLPLLAVLRPEGDGAKRSLQCSLCLTEWTYRRVLCPFCGETDRDKLPRYSADECLFIRVEACETCRRYLKSVDLSIDGRAVPLVDEVALAALDVWAAEQGLSKIVPNLLGF